MIVIEVEGKHDFLTCADNYDGKFLEEFKVPS